MKLTKFQKQYFKDNPQVQWPLCSCGCGERVLLDYTNSNSVFRRFASASCSRKSKTISPNIVSLLSNKEWVFEQRVTRKKSKENIAKELGISVTPVNKWLKIHGLQDLRYNESENKIQQVLSNKNKLEQDYTAGKTISTLSKEYGTSPATISRFFAKHGIKTRPSNFYDRCNNISKEEQDLVDWMKSIIDDKEIIQSSRSIIPPQELDVIIPSKRIAIEYNGLYSHLYRPEASTPSLIKGPGYHIGKLLRCKEHNYTLIHIFSDQWKKRNTAVKTLLMSKLGVNKKIHGRLSIVRVINTSEKNTFLNTYHIQGADKSTVKLGLFYQDELVAVMTFGKPRFSRQHTWELTRYCGKLGLSVVGGFSKLLSYFIKNYCKAGETIVSYADRCFSSGEVYEKNGFKLTRINRPSYHYVILNTETRVPRTTYTKKRLLQQLEITQTNKSESELAKDLGLEKTFDCGTLTYTFYV